jgi:hypothetical protein
MKVLKLPLKVFSNFLGGENEVRGLESLVVVREEINLLFD